MAGYFGMIQCPSMTSERTLPSSQHTPTGAWGLNPSAVSFLTVTTCTYSTPLRGRP